MLDNELKCIAPAPQEAWPRLVLENALDAVVGISPEDVILEWNHQAEITFGWTKTQAIGHKMADLIIPTETRERHRHGIIHFLSTGEGPILNRRIEVTALHKNGRLFPVELTIMPVLVEGKYQFYSFVRDITDRVVAEQARESAALDQRLLADLSAQYAKTTEEAEMVLYATTNLAKRLGATRCWLSEVNSSTSTATVHVDYALGHPSLKGTYPLMAFGPEMVSSWYEGRVVSLSDVRTDSRTSMNADQHLTLGIGSFITIPLHRGGHLIGALNVSVPVPRQWSGSECELVRAVAENLWSVIENNRLFRELQEQNLLNRTITDNAASCLFMIDPQGYPTFMNPAAVEVTGYQSLDEIKDRPLHETVHWKKSDGTFYWVEECPLVRAQRELTTVKNQEEIFCKKDGTLFPVSYSIAPIQKNGKRVGSALEFRDITEIKKAENDLRESENQLRLLADAIPHLVWMANSDGSIFWMNRRWYEFTGTAPHEMENLDWKKFHHPQELPHILERWNQSLKTGEPFDMEFQLRSATGQFHWFLTRVEPIKDAFGRVVRWFGTNTSIDEQHKMRKSLEEAVRSRDEFISICSHELKTPVTSLKLQFQLAERQMKKGDLSVYAPEACQRRIHIANQQLDRMIHLIEEMLDVSRIETGKLQVTREVVDFYALTSEVLERFGDNFAALNIKVQFNTQPIHAIILGDRYRLEQVISNLITNAVKYGAGKPIHVSVERDDPWVRLIVTDYGMGISNENLSRIFDRFERAISSNHISGLGLGLYISRQIVEEHQGHIRVRSELEHGSTFTVEFPLYDVNPQR